MHHAYYRKCTLAMDRSIIINMQLEKGDEEAEYITCRGCTRIYAYVCIMWKPGAMDYMYTCACHHVHVLIIRKLL